MTVGEHTGGSVRCEGVSKKFNIGTEHEIVVVDDVDLSIGTGEFVVLLGPSGCGKSTLLSMVCGLEAPSQGEITLEGRPVRGPGPDRCMVFQSSSLYPWMSVQDNVAYGLKLRGVPKGERRRVAVDKLTEMGLRDVAGKHPEDLSGGMRQRVAIARSLVMEPQVLLMDEPFGALDVQTRAKMQNIVADAWRTTRTSILFVTHSIDEAVSLADRIVVLTARPARVKAQIEVHLERPRDSRDPEYHQLHSHLIDLLADEVDQAFREQEL